MYIVQAQYRSADILLYLNSSEVFGPTPRVNLFCEPFSTLINAIPKVMTTVDVSTYSICIPDDYLN